MVKGIDNIATKEDILGETRGLVAYMRKCHSGVI